MDDAHAAALKAEILEAWSEASSAWLKHAADVADMTRAATDVLLAGARLRPGANVLDVACGPGESAFAAARLVAPGGSVVATDFAPEMVAGAERIAAARGVEGVTFRVADAEALPFPDGSFDAVTCRYGVMFFPRPEQAMREFRRVLRPGGRASLVAWGPREANPYMSAIVGPFMRRLGGGPPEDPDAPTPFRFAAPGRLAAVLRAGGFDDVEEEVKEIPWVYSGTPERVWAVAQDLSSSAFQGFREKMTPADLAAASQEALAAIRARYDGKKVDFTATIVHTTGTRIA